MLNYNYNIIAVKSGSHGRPNSDIVNYFWDNTNRTSVIANDNLNSITPTVFSMNTIGSNALGIVTSSGGNFDSQYIYPATASIQGNGRWPTTGSVTMSLYISAPTINPPYSFFGAISCSAQANNITAKSGSIISASYLNALGAQYFVSASTIHHKGNEYNPKVNWKASGSGQRYANPLSSVTSQFSILKDVNVLLHSQSIVTASNSGSFNYDYAFNVTSSLSSSWNWQYNMGGVSASYLFGTASLSIPEVGITVTSSFSSSYLTASFAANTNIPYTITASLDMHVLPAFSASIILLAGGGGGAAGGGGDNVTIYGNGGGGGAGGYYTANINVLPYKTNTLVSCGVGGDGGVASGNPTGSIPQGKNGTSSSISYWNTLDTQLTIGVGGGFGGRCGSNNNSGSGGASGNGYAASGSGGAGTVATSSAFNGANYLGGGAGAYGYNTGVPISPYLRVAGYGGESQTITLPAPFNNVVITPSGSGGGGGTFYPGYGPPYTGTGFDGVNGGGGGGASDSFVTSAPGGKGGDGIAILAYYGVPKLTINGGYTNYISSSNLTLHYLTGSGATWDYVWDGTDIPYQ
jgi:hypothetical protein